MNRYIVWSTHEDGDKVEVTRSERRVAEEDVSIIRGIFGRRAWVQDSQEGAK